MAWADLANNQMVSFTDAQSSGFPLNGGQSHVTSNQCMTKSEALIKYSVSSAAMDTYDSNQLVPKGVWQSAAITSYPYLISFIGDSTPSLSCSFNSDYNVDYSSSSTLGIGTVLYDDPGLTTPFDGFDLYWKSGDTDSTIRINPSGVITEMIPCSLVPPP